MDFYSSTEDKNKSEKEAYDIYPLRILHYVMTKFSMPPPLKIRPWDWKDDSDRNFATSWKNTPRTLLNFPKNYL